MDQWVNVSACQLVSGLIIMLHPPEQEQYDKNFDLVNIKYLKFDNVKSVIFTKLESSTSQKQVHLAYMIDSGSNSNLKPFKICRTVFPI